MSQVTRESSTPKRSNLFVRVMSAVVAVPVILYMLFWGPGWAWPSFLLLAAAIAAQELFAMTLRDQPRLQVWSIASTLAVAVSVYGTVARPAAWLPPSDGLFPYLVIALPLASMVVSLTRPLPSDVAGTRMAWMVAGPFYVGSTIASLGALHTLPYGAQWLVLSMMLAWFADTSGYFAGRFLGGRVFGRGKMSPNISPNKTWEGAAGAILGSLLGALLAHFWYLPILPLGGAIGLALTAGPLGILGDLVESLIKRSTNTKDSGWIVPGHGGLIDRIDALMFTATATLFYARLVLGL